MKDKLFIAAVIGAVIFSVCGMFGIGVTAATKTQPTPYEAQAPELPEYVTALQSLHPEVVNFGELQAATTIDSELERLGSPLRITDVRDKAIYQVGVNDALFRIQRSLEIYGSSPAEDADTWASLQWLHTYWAK